MRPEPVKVNVTIHFVDAQTTDLFVMVSITMESNDPHTDDFVREKALRSPSLKEQVEQMLSRRHYVAVGEQVFLYPASSIVRIEMKCGPISWGIA